MTRELLYEMIRREVDKGVAFCNVETIRETINFYSIRTDIKEDNVDRVVEYLETTFGCAQMLANRARTQNLVWARNLFFWYLVSKRKWTLTRVSREYKYHHATVLRAVDLVENAHRTNEFYYQINEFKKLFI